MRNSRRPKGEGSITKLPKWESVIATNKAELIKWVTELRVAIGEPRDTKMYLKWNEDTLSSNTLKNYKYMDKIRGEMINMVLDNINKDKYLKDPTMAGNLVFSAFGGSLVF